MNQVHVDNFFLLALVRLRGNNKIKLKKKVVRQDISEYLDHLPVDFENETMIFFCRIQTHKIIDY